MPTFCRRDDETWRHGGTRLSTGQHGIPHVRLSAIWSPALRSLAGRIHRGDRWGAWESIYFERWYGWAPLSLAERQRAHHRAWQEHLRAEGWTKDSKGSYWWKNCGGPNPEVQCAHVDLIAGLRLARQRSHERDYSHEWSDDLQ
jgi:hypothetical protein